MNPDSIIAGLRKELDRVPADATDRREVIEKEIAYWDTLPRPVAKPNGGTTVANPTRVYYDALKQEMARASEANHESIQREMDWAKGQLQEADVADEPSETEIEQRKRVRGGKKGVEQARNAPVPDQTAPASAKEKP